MFDQLVVFGVIILTLVFFVNGKLRYDFVALLAIITLSLFRIITFEEAFSGFSHPAVITIISVLVISSALIKTGAINQVVIILNKVSDNVSLKIFSLMLITAFLSGFMNNIGALALILPIAIRVAKDSKISPSKLLMPVAFASLIGGMTTLIGTPPNLIVSTYRAEAIMSPYAFFDFAKTGVLISLIGIIFVSFIGWRLIPQREANHSDLVFKTEDYLSEVVVVAESKMLNKPLRDFFEVFKLEVDVLSIIRNKRKIILPKASDRLREDDVLIIKADSSQLKDLIDKTEMHLKGAKLTFLESQPLLKSEEFELVEVVIRRDSPLNNRTAFEMKLRNRYNVNLVAVSRKGVSSMSRLKSFRFREGDILLIQAPKSIAQDIFDKLLLLPLAERGLAIDLTKNKFNRYLALGMFAVAIVLVSFGFLPVQIAFALTAILLVVFKVITPREFHQAIEWPSIFMIGALLPLGSALSSSGASNTIANQLVRLSTVFPPAVMLILIMVITIALTNLIGNTPAAVLMAPIASSLALAMHVSYDPFLIAVSIAASSAFLTPIAHQSNMLVMGPGGYSFTDFYKLGLPLTILVIGVSVPTILFFWPI